MSDPLEREVLYLLSDVARLLRTRADRRARLHGMTRAQWVILSRLERQPGLSQNEIAGLVELEPISVARLVDKLQDHGYVERRPDPKDRRVWRLHLTAAAKPMLKIIRKHRGELKDEVTEGLDAKALAAAIDSLLIMKANLSNGRSSLRTG